MSAGGQGQMMNPAMRGGLGGMPNPAARGGYPGMQGGNPAARGMGYPGMQGGMPNPAAFGQQPGMAYMGGSATFDESAGAGGGFDGAGNPLNPAARGAGMGYPQGGNPASRNMGMLQRGIPQFSPSMLGGPLGSIAAALNPNGAGMQPGNPMARGGPMAKPMADGGGIQAPTNPVLLNPAAVAPGQGIGQPDIQQRNISQDQPWQVGQKTGTWLDDYLNPMGDGFTGTRNSHNYINGHPFAPEFNAQMAGGPNGTSFAFGNALNTYGDRMRQLGILR